MMIFTLPDYHYFNKPFVETGKFGVGKYKTNRFSNGTTLISLTTEIREEECVIIGGATSDSNLIETLFLAHTLKKEGASKIIVVFPYIAYARQDEDRLSESWGAKWLGDLCAASGISEVVTLDMHSPLAQECFPMPIISISASDILAKAIKKDVTISGLRCIAPDEGAIDNCELLDRALGIAEDISYFKKTRDSKGIKMLSLEGKIGKNVIVSDDILDTGETLVAACEILKKRGVKNIIVVITHGLFNGSAWKKLWGMGVSRIYCTDSHPAVRKLSSAGLGKRSRCIIVVSSGDIIADHFV